MNWKECSNLDLMNALKNELIRLGLQDNPSRTAYQNNYDPDLAPAATTVMYRTGQSWNELMKIFGFDYDTRSYKDVSKEEVLDIIVKAIHKADIRGYMEFMLRAKDIKAPSAQTLTSYGMDWQDVQERHKELYGAYILPPTKRGSWRYLSTDELLDIMANEMKKKGFMSVTEYINGRDTENTPNVVTVKKRLNNSTSQLGEELEKRLGYSVVKKRKK